MTTVAIMQPTYLPWLGFFDMIDQADKFIFLDQVAIDRKSWQTRNRILGRDGKPVWLSIPTSAKRGDILSTVRIANEHNWQTKHIRSVTQAYAHLENYESIHTAVGLMAAGWISLTAYTKTMIMQLCYTLGIQTEFVEAPWVGGGRIDRIDALCEATGADELLNALGAKHLYPDNFPVPIRWHEYEPQRYEQNGGAFVSHLSVVDALARLGPEKTLDLVRSGRMAPSEA